MEIGFAAARGVPVVILTTDFQSYGPHTDGSAFASPSRCWKCWPTESNELTASLPQAGVRSGPVQRIPAT